MAKKNSSKFTESTAIESSVKSNGSAIDASADAIDFSKIAPLSELQRLRSYSRRSDDGSRETWDQTCDRVLYSPHLGLQVLGKFTPEEMALIDEQLRSRKGFGSARWLWVGGTEWVEDPGQYEGAFNCTAYDVIDWDTFGLLMDLGMKGCGTGAKLELSLIDRLPVIRNPINLAVIGEFGGIPKEERLEKTVIDRHQNEVSIIVGDSRQGWVKAYQSLMELASDESFTGAIDLTVDISNVRAKGERLKGFGGTANPIKIPDMFENCTKILNGSVGRKLNSLEVCLLIGEAASCYVAGNIRRAAGMKQGSSNDEIFASSKDGLWKEVNGQWIIDPDRDSLRTANHTRVYHHKPSLEELIEAVRKQFYSGEGAIQYAPEAIARANADILSTPERKQEFLNDYIKGVGSIVLTRYAGGAIEGRELRHRLGRYSLNPCGL